MRKINWDALSIDWTRPDRALSKEHGISVSALAMRRAKIGIEPTRKFVDWNGCDWTLPDWRIAELKGCAVHTVQTARYRLTNIPNPKRKKAGRKVKEGSRTWTVMAKAKLSERKTVHEWLNKAGIPTHEADRPLCLLRRLRITIDMIAAKPRHNSILMKSPLVP